MDITIICGDKNHAIVPYLKLWIKSVRENKCSARIVFDESDIRGGDLLFALSYGKKLDDSVRNLFKSCLVLHASDLPKGAGWSPHIWEIVNGGNVITVSLFEAEEKIDSGKIWFKQDFRLNGTELLHEINEKLFEVELELMTLAVERFGSVSPYYPKGERGPHLKRRTPSNSELDPSKTIAEQFDLLRTVDNDKYPAFFSHRGRRYKIKIYVYED